MVVADRLLFRTALAATLANEHDLDVVGEFDTACELDRMSADVAIVDVDAPHGHGLPVAKLDERSTVRSVVVLTTEPGRRTLRYAATDRVRGMVAKDGGLDDLVDTVRRVAAGERVMAPDATGNPLTAREREVLQLAAEGLPSRRIADDLNLTVGTVRNYISGIVRKTSARNRLEAIRAADEAGWL